MPATIPTSEHTAREATSSERFASLPADVVNALAEQRNDIMAAIGNAVTVADIRAAEKLLRLVSHLWHTVGYGYKVVDVRARLILRCREMAQGERRYAAGCGRFERAARESCEAKAAALEACAMTTCTPEP